jgi:hypothetical protein
MITYDAGAAYTLVLKQPDAVKVIQFTMLELAWGRRHVCPPGGGGYT